MVFFPTEDEYFFTDAESKLSKYSPKGWKSSSTHVSTALFLYLYLKTNYLLNASILIIVLVSLCYDTEFTMTADFIFSK